MIDRASYPVVNGANERIFAAFSRRREPYVARGRVHVPTDVILPTHDLAVVVVEGGAADDRYTLGDGGHLFNVLDMQGYTLTQGLINAVTRVARQAGAFVQGYEIVFGPVTLDAATALIAHMAELEREAMIAAFKMLGKMERRALKDRITELLSGIAAAGTVSPAYKMQGSTTATHKFDFALALPGRDRVLLDVPVPDPHSIAATMLRQADIAQLRMPQIRQLITFDPQDNWPSSSLAQLQLAGVPLVDVSVLRETILH